MPSEVRLAEIAKLLRAKGYVLARVRGSHHVFAEPGGKAFTVPVHHGKVKYGYVRHIHKLDDAQD